MEPRPYPPSFQSSVRTVRRLACDRVVEDRQSLLQGSDFCLAALLPLLERDAHVVARWCKVSTVLHDLCQLLLIGREFNLRVAQPFVLLPLLRRFGEFGLREVLSELLVLRKHVRVRNFCLLLALHKLRSCLTVPRLKILYHLQRAATSSTLVRAEWRLLLVLRSRAARANLNE